MLAHQAGLLCAAVALYQTHAIQRAWVAWQTFVAHRLATAAAETDLLQQLQVTFCQNLIEKTPDYPYYLD